MREGRGVQQFVAASYAKAEGAVDCSGSWPYLDGLSLGGYCMCEQCPKSWWTKIAPYMSLRIRDLPENERPGVSPTREDFEKGASHVRLREGEVGAGRVGPKETPTYEIDDAEEEGRAEAGPSQPLRLRSTGRSRSRRRKSKCERRARSPELCSDIPRGRGETGMEERAREDRRTADRETQYERDRLLALGRRFPRNAMELAIFDGGREKRGEVLVKAR